MSRTNDSFTRFEHEGWVRVADRYDSVWASLTRQFIPLLLDAVGVTRGMPVLDVACGPGYLAAAARDRGAVATGVDFAATMVAIGFRSSKATHKTCPAAMRLTTGYCSTSGSSICRVPKRLAPKHSAS